ncbi:MAG TPA: metallophosphoesterase family protein [Gaiellaceae bacterium]|nr:metallophosphoesterase family protein [Gaiellaceae bacterium]
MRTGRGGLREHRRAGAAGSSARASRRRGGRRAHRPGPHRRPEGGPGERLVAWFPGCDAVVYGHTHLPQLEQHRGVWILNPGSPTERRRAPARSMLAVETAPGAELDIEQVFV